MYGQPPYAQGNPAYPNQQQGSPYGGYPQQPGYPQPGQPGHPQPGQPGYPQPGQPGYPQPGYPGQQGSPYGGQPGYPQQGGYPGQPQQGQPGPQGSPYGQPVYPNQQGAYPQQGGYPGHQGSPHGVQPQQGQFPPHQTHHYPGGSVEVRYSPTPAQSQGLQAGQQINFRMGNNKFLRANPNGNFDAQADVAGDWERFTLERTTVPNTFAIRSAHGKLLCWSGNHMETRDAAGDWERFELQEIGPNQYYLYSPAHRVFINSIHGFLISSPDRKEARAVSINVVGGGGQPAIPQQQGLQAGQQINFRMGNNKFLRANPNGNFDAQADVAGDWERFTLERTTVPNTFAIRSAHGKILCWSEDGKRMETRDAVGEWERFELRPSIHDQYFLYSPFHRVFINSVDGFIQSFRDQNQAHSVSVAVVGGPGMGSFPRF